MAILDIRKYGDPILKKKALAVTDFGPETQRLFDDMLETMYANNGVGLAANQVGELKRMVVLDSGSHEHPQVLMLANPEIFYSSRDKIPFEEGCLSFPGITEKIDRPAVIKVKYQDNTGKHCEAEADGFLAVILQHEIDHINGVEFINRMSPVKRMLHNKELKELKKKTRGKK